MKNKDLECCANCKHLYWNNDLYYCHLVDVTSLLADSKEIDESCDEWEWDDISHEARISKGTWEI